MFFRSVRAAGVAALFAASALCSSPGDAGDKYNWYPKKSQRETLHPGDCQFGYYGTNWRAWPEGCDRGNGCANRFAPALPSSMTPQPMTPSLMTPLPTMPAPSWSTPQFPNSQNPWSQLPPVPQMGPDLRVPQLPPPGYIPPHYGPVPMFPPAPGSPLPPLESVPPAAQPIPNIPAPVDQRVPVPPMPTTRVAPSRGATPAVVPAGGSARSVPATLSPPDFGPSSIQPMNYSAPRRSDSSVPKPLMETAPRRNGPVMLLPPEF
ncbi:MAG: hypothetical protein ACKV2Q_03350 [Planctomycetaceae bacterium]